MLSLQAQKAKKVSKAETLLEKAGRDAKVQKVIGKKPAGRGRGKGRGKGSKSPAENENNGDVNPDSSAKNPQDLDANAGGQTADAHPKECDADLVEKWNQVDTCPELCFFYCKLDWPF